MMPSRIPSGDAVPGARRPKALAPPPVLPAARARALAMLADEEVSLGDLASAVQADPALTLTMLRAANSAHSASRRPIDHPRDAIIRLGLAATKRFVAAAVVGDAFADPAACGIDVEAVWSHSLAVAVMAESACTNSRLRPASFSAGLLHNIGRLALAQSEPRAYPVITERATDEGTVLAAERVIFGEDYAAAGQRILLGWGLSPEIAEAVGRHQHEQATDDLGRALRQARIVAEAMGFADGLPRSFAPSEQPPVDPKAAATLQARIDWYRAALHRPA